MRQGVRQANKQKKTKTKGTGLISSGLQVGRGSCGSGYWLGAVMREGRGTSNEQYLQSQILGRVSHLMELNQMPRLGQ